MSDHAVPRRDVWIPSCLPFVGFGILYYLISPIFVLKFLADDNDLLNVAKRYLDASYFDGYYLLDVIVIGVSFVLGYRLAAAVTRPRHSILDCGSYQASYALWLAASFSMLILYYALTAHAAGAVWFTGYTTYNILVLGPLSTCVFLSVWFINYFSDRWSRLVYFLLFAFCSMLLLGWGSRMYVVMSSMALMLGLVSKNAWLLRSPRFYGVLAGFFLLMVGVGVLREGGRDFSTQAMTAIFFAEPLFTSISGSLFLEFSGGRPMDGVPVDLYASLIHFIPSALYPGKIEVVGELTSNQNILSPFGARALLVSLYSNFGFLYPLYIASIGLYLGVLREKARHSVFYAATYFSALPIMVFLFFRETMLNVIKVMFFNGLIVPWLIALILLWISPRFQEDIRRKRSYSTRGSYCRVTGTQVAGSRSSRFSSRSVTSVANGLG